MITGIADIKDIEIRVLRTLWQSFVEHWYVILITHDSDETTRINMPQTLYYNTLHFLEIIFFLGTNVGHEYRVYN